MTSSLGNIVNRAKAISTEIKAKAQVKDRAIVDERNRRPRHKENSLQRRRSWVTVLVTICFALFALQTSVIFFFFYIIHPLVPTPNTNKLFDEFDFPSVEIIEDTIPFIQHWHQQNHLQGITSQRYYSAFNQTLGRANNTRMSCIDVYMREIEESIPTTSPSYVRLVLKNFGDHLYNSPLIQSALHDLLNEPRGLHSMYEESQECLGDNHPFVELACVAHEYIEAPSLHDDDDMKIVFQYMVNLSAVLETLTKLLDRDFQALNVLSEAMTTSRRKEIEHHYEVAYSHDEAFVEFLLAKYRTVLAAIQQLVVAKEFGSIPPSRNTDALLQLNILEAVKLDLIYNREDNARVGLTLAANSKSGRYIESHELLNKLDENWIDAYIAWNFVFVMTSLNKEVDKIGKLLIPSISCTKDMNTRDRFLQRRSISLALALMHLHDSTNTDAIIDINEKEALTLQHFYDTMAEAPDDDPQISMVANALGKSNVESVSLTDPDDDTVWKMLYNLCGEKCHGPQLRVTDTGMSSFFLADEDFWVFMGFINWLTVIISGSGSEMFMILIYMKNGWDSNHEDQWKVAQFLFSILALVSLGLASARNHLALLTLVVGCWKFGFPETVAPMFCALFDKRAGKIKRFSFALDSIGTALHHSSASLVICMLLSGVITPNRYVFDPILVLCMQHWFVLLCEYFPTLYIGIQLVLEVWFEWSVISNLEHYVANHWTAEVAASGMLLAHWIWFVAGALSILMEKRGMTVIQSNAESPDEASDFYENTKRDNDLPGDSSTNRFADEASDFYENTKRDNDLPGDPSTNRFVDDDISSDFYENTKRDNDLPGDSSTNRFADEASDFYENTKRDNDLPGDPSTNRFVDDDISSFDY